MKQVISWNDALAKARLESPGSDVHEPLPHVVWYAYGKGKVLGFSEDGLQATKNKFKTDFIEKVAVNQAEINAWRDLQAAVEYRAKIIWQKSLEEFYSDIPKDIFEVCYGEAYDKAHAGGYDNMANEMESVVGFARRIARRRFKSCHSD